MRLNMVLTAYSIGGNQRELCQGFVEDEPSSPTDRQRFIPLAFNKVVMSLVTKGLPAPSPALFQAVHLCR